MRGRLRLNLPPDTSHKGRLEDIIALQQDEVGEDLFLNPDWLEWLMGLPVGYSDPTVQVSLDPPLPFDADIGCQWAEEPDIAPASIRANKHHKARIEALGATVVPQIVEQIGRAFIAADEAFRD